MFIFQFHRYILSPFGKSLGIKSTRTKRATLNPILEAAYNNCSRIHHKTVSSSMGIYVYNNNNSKMCNIIKVCPLLLRQHTIHYSILDGFTILLFLVYKNHCIQYSIWPMLSVDNNKKFILFWETYSRAFCFRKCTILMPDEKKINCVIGLR